ncbi:hypothetical protein C2G38_2184267 [Gigaspora rosea]|uniref:Uncharacterized protein n=1 Tax=Gigaspora rosea TaxID=44941 RepID=A0A397V805_9GLOM|nr:hypothetical protein C2G38_2184267 [Gigaspora rosea]CAG8712529.1 2801_t:CDS:1 [Gigaspora rosea]
MPNTQSKIDLLKKLNSKLQAENTELRNENAKVKHENAELRQDLEGHESRITKLEQVKKEKSISTINSNNIPDALLFDIFDNTSNSDIYQESLTQPKPLIISRYHALLIYKSKSLKDKAVDNFVTSVSLE